MSDRFDFDEKQYQSFMRRLEQDFIITILLEMKGGYSGARTSLVQIEPRDPSNARADKGKYILKVCLAEDAEREKRKHAKAKANGILGEHVPKLVTPISYEGIPLVGIFYQIAGEDLLTRATLQDQLEQHPASPNPDDFLNKQIEEVVSTLLQWNFKTTQIDETPDLLRTILQGIGERHWKNLPQKELAERFKGIAEHIQRPGIHLTPLVDISKYNPIHFLCNLDEYKETKLRHMPCIIPIGMLHGDLHPGNVIMCKEEQMEEHFHIIDFASSRSGNVFSDLAYLEISLILNSSGGFDRMLDLSNWWAWEQHLISKHLPSEETFQNPNQEGLWRVLPIRRALDACIKSAGKSAENDYWIAFLAASVEAGLDLARKLHHNSSLQRVAFLTAVCRFHRLIELLDALRIPPRGEMATIYFPGDKLPPPLEEEEIESSLAGTLPRTQKRRSKDALPCPIELVWPNEITDRASLYDTPWKMMERIWSQLTGKNNQGVLLLGERKFGKSSFFNCVGSLFQKNGGAFRTVRLNTLGISHTAQSFSKELLEETCNSVGLENYSALYNNEKFQSNRFFSAYHSVVMANRRLRFVICIDEIDSTLLRASSQEDAREILQILHRLLTDPRLPIRLLLTATDKEKLKDYPGGMDFLNDLDIWGIPLCNDGEIKDLIECFNVQATFEKDAIERISYYSGGQIYFIKLPVVLIRDIIRTTQSNGKSKMRVDAELVDKYIRDVIAPISDTPLEIRNRHGAVSDTMENIYKKSPFFSDEERQFMYLLTKAGGVLKASSSEVSNAQLATIASRLSQRGYISKTVTEEEEEYRWRIGIWQLFLENYLQLKYRRS